MDSSLMRLLCYEALNSARDYPRARQVLEDDAKAIRLGVAKLHAVYVFLGAHTEAPVPALGAALFKVYAGQAREFVGRAIGTTTADDILRSRADLILATAAEEADEVLGGDIFDEAIMLTADAMLVEALCVARYALEQARERGPGWEELAASTAVRISSELEVHGHG